MPAAGSWRETVYISEWAQRKGGTERGGPYETEKVQASVGILGTLEARENTLVLMKLALLDRNVDPDDVLPHDAPRTDIQMAVACMVSGTSGAKDKDSGKTDPTSELPMSPSERPTASP